MASIHMILAIGTSLDMEMHQIDIKGTYLNGELTNDKVVYMKQPPGYSAPGSAGKVCCLNKTLYGLKQSGHRWYQKLVEILVNNLTFTCCKVDQAVFMLKNDDGLTIIAVHVDDYTIVATTVRLIENVKARICKFVEISDLGELHWLLGIEICCD
jgi:Reverse transcriptase (RNA-dependent DNA polymerase)